MAQSQWDLPNNPVVRTPISKPRIRRKTHSKTGRRQHRSCDQCRKGKRACDAAILDGPVSEPSISTPLPAGPASFHVLWAQTQVNHGSTREARIDDSQDDGSVIPVGPCSNCAKTGKECTFEWLRQTYQELLKRKQRQNTENPVTKDEVVATPLVQYPPAPQSNGSAAVAYSIGSDDDSITDHPKLPRSSLTRPFHNLDFLTTRQSPKHVTECDYYPEMSSVGAPNAPLFNTGIGRPYSRPDTVDESDEGSVPYEVPDLASNSTITSAGSESPAAKRRRKSLGAHSHFAASKTQGTSHGLESYPPKRDNGQYNNTPLSLAYSLSRNESNSMHQRLIASTNRSLITTSLIRIYHDSMENALSCWLTERTCPYRNDLALTTTSQASNPVESMLNEWGPQWSNRIYYRVHRLDRVSASIRDRPLTEGEDKAASKALQLAVVAFATQWAQASERSTAKYTGHAGTASMSGIRNSFGKNGSSSEVPPAFPIEFDRTMQETNWHQARRALQATADIESFRVIFAHIIFSLTQRPLDVNQKIESFKRRQRMTFEKTTKDPYNHSDFDFAGIPLFSTDGEEEDGAFDLSELEEVLDCDGPPLFLETAIRQLHSYRCKLERIQRERTSKMRGIGNSDPLSEEDRKTFNLLFWLCVMFDTLSSAMNKRPLVVSDEDSNILAEPVQPADSQGHFNYRGEIIAGVPSSQYSSVSSARESEIWGGYFLDRNSEGKSPNIPRWPCSYEDAAATLCDAAPVKVLLFRKVTRLQTLLSRKAKPEKLELAIYDALSVYDYWNENYGPFILDCVANHDNLPARIQSWYVVLTGHWHLAGLLLADTIDSIDESRLGTESQRRNREASSLMSRLRRQNAIAVSELGRCSSPRDDCSFLESGEFHHAVNRGALLTEPWTVVLIRSFAKAGRVFLDSIPPFSSATTTKPTQSMANQASTTPPGAVNIGIEEGRKRLDHCTQGLWYLGRKSDMAFLAATMLSTAAQAKEDRLRSETLAQAAFSFSGGDHVPLSSLDPPANSASSYDNNAVADYYYSSSDQFPFDCSSVPAEAYSTGFGIDDF